MQDQSSLCALFENGYKRIFGFMLYVKADSVWTKGSGGKGQILKTHEAWEGIRKE